MVVLLVKRNEDLAEHRFSSDEFSNENLKNFLRQHSGLYLPLDGCLETFDHLVDEAMASTDEAGRFEAILTKMEEAAGQLGDPADKKKADRYIKVRWMASVNLKRRRSETKYPLSPDRAKAHIRRRGFRGQGDATSQEPGGQEQREGDGPEEAGTPPQDQRFAVLHEARGEEAGRAVARSHSNPRLAQN